MKRLSAIVLAAASTLYVVSAHAAYQITSMTMTDLGTLGGAESEGNDVNDGGHVVGTSYNGAAIRRGFFHAGGVMTDVGATLGAWPSEARGINNSDQVVGWWTDAAGMHGYRWQSGLIYPLNPGPPIMSVVESQAEAIAENGRIVGQRQYTDVGFTSATMWTGLAGAFPLDPWSDSGYMSSKVTDVDELGRATGWSYWSHWDWVWDYYSPPPFGEPVAPPLPIPAYTYFEASPNGLHENGAIVGSMRFYKTVDSNVTIKRAFYWGGVAINSQILGVLPGGNSSWADDVNAQRFIVGASNFSASPLLKPVSYSAFIYHANFGMVALPRGHFSNCYARALSARNQNGAIYVAGTCDSAAGKRAVRWNLRVAIV